MRSITEEVRQIDTFWQFNFAILIAPCCSRLAIRMRRSRVLIGDSQTLEPRCP